MLKRKLGFTTIPHSILLLLSILLVSSVESASGSVHPSFCAGDYNILDGTSLSGSVPSSVASVDADYFFVRSVGTDTPVNTYNPTGYALLGSTSLVLGSVSNLTSDDDLHMVFNSYFSGSDIEDYVDKNSSNVDSTIDKGAHSNFTAQQYAPDSVHDILTEEKTSGGTEVLNLYVNTDDETKTEWSKVGTNPYLDAVDYNSSYVHTSGNNKLVGDFGFADSGKSTETINSITVQLYARQSSVDINLEVFVWNGSVWTSLGVQTTPTSWDWMSWTATKELDTWTKIDGAKIYIVSGPGTSEVDCARLQVDYTAPDNYELDLEVQWTSVDFDETNEQLCIYGGTTGAENICVHVWNGSVWENLFPDLNSGWNNISVSSYLDSSTFTIRFKGSIETFDTTQDTWNIDAVLLHTWTSQHLVEVEFAGSSNTYSWKQLNWTIDSAWTIGSVNVTVQLYNNTLGDYPVSGNGCMAYTSSSTPNADDVRHQLIMSNPQDFRNDTGGWKIRVKGVESTGTQFVLKVDLIEYKPTNSEQTSLQPFNWFTTLLFVLPFIFVLLFLLTLKLRRKKATASPKPLQSLEGSLKEPKPEKTFNAEETDAFSEQFGMTHQQMIGKKMLLEIDPTSDYQKALSDFVSETKNNDELLIIITNTNSTLHSAFSGTNNVKFLLLSSKTSNRHQISEKEALLPESGLSVLIGVCAEIQKAEREKTINLIFDDLSGAIQRHGFEKIYKFMSWLLEAISSPKTTALFIFNPTAHDPTISSSIRGMFQMRLAYPKRRPKVETS